MKHTYNAPMLICDEFEMDSNITASGYNIKEGNSGNNSQCYTDDEPGHSGPYWDKNNYLYCNGTGGSVGFF